jgi:hypothetical protein
MAWKTVSTPAENEPPGAKIVGEVPAARADEHDEDADGQSTDSANAPPA